jgi:hypothetical protein
MSKIKEFIENKDANIDDSYFYDQWLKARNIREKAKYNTEIDKAVSEVKKGNFISHEDVIKEMSDW